MRQNHSQCYLESGCLNSFKCSYGSLFEQEVNGLDLRGLRIQHPSSSLESLDGTTLDKFLLDEALQMHASQEYWKQRIEESSLLG